MKRDVLLAGDYVPAGRAERLYASTNYNQQHKVFEAAKSSSESEQKPKFTEIRLPQYYLSNNPDR